MGLFSLFVLITGFSLHPVFTVGSAWMSETSKAEQSVVDNESHKYPCSRVSRGNRVFT